MTYGAHELVDQHENMKTITKVNKERQSMKGKGTFREPLGELCDLEKIAFGWRGVQDVALPSGMCLVVNVLPVLHDAFNYSHEGHLKGQSQAGS